MSVTIMVNDILSHIGRNGGRENEWYVGITNDPVRRLFSDHAVDQKADAWIYRPAASSASARLAEATLINMGFDGGTGGGGPDAYIVYAYKKGPRTIQ